MNKTEIIVRLTGLALPKSEYWVIAGSAMALYGLREHGAAWHQERHQ